MIKIPSTLRSASACLRFIRGRLVFAAASLLLIFSACNNDGRKFIQGSYADTSSYNNVLKYNGVTSSPDSVLETNEIPVLCYHQVRDWIPSDSKSARVFILPVDGFKEQMKLLHDQGFNSISPDQLIDYMKGRGKLPSHPVMLTFDDATESQYVNALPELDKYNYKGVFFIMTVVLGHKRYMTTDNVKQLSLQGHTIGCHTWNHEEVTKYKEEDWITQLDKPVKELENITGHPIRYFAYPYGIWNNNAVEHLKKQGMIAAFRLWGKYDSQEPLFTIRRILVDGSWSPAQLLNAIKKDPLKTNIHA